MTAAPNRLLLVLIGAMAAGPIFNFALSALSPLILQTYDITEGQYGAIITVTFLAGAATSTVLGVLSDKISVRVQILAIFALMAVVFWVSVVRPTYPALLVAALIAGPAQAASNPATNRIIATHVPQVQRGAWMGWKQSGVQFGLLFTGLTAPLIGGAFGWFGITVTMSVIYAGLFAAGWFVLGALPASPTSTPAAGSAAATPDAPEGKARLPLAVWLLTICSFLNALGTQGTNSFAALFAVQRVNYPVELAGVMLAIIGVLGILARNAWGRINHRFSSAAVVIQLMNLGGIIAMACFLAVEQWRQPALLWAGVVFHAALPLAANVVINSALVRATPSGRIGVASGLVASGMYLGFAVGPLLIGQGVDRWGSYLPGWGVVAASYALCFAVAVVLHRRRRTTSH